MLRAASWLALRTASPPSPHAALTPERRPRLSSLCSDAGNLASTGFDPQESFRAHRAYYPNAAISLGFEVPPEAWGGNIQTLADVTKNSAYVRAQGGAGGTMVWSLPKQGTPSAQSIVTTACQAMGMAGCAAALPM